MEVILLDKICEKVWAGSFSRSSASTATPSESSSILLLNSIHDNEEPTSDRKLD